MSNTDAITGRPLPANGLNPVLASMARGLASPQLGALLTLATALTLGVGLIVWGMQPEYVPVSEQGSRQDTLQIIEMLKTSGVEYKLDSTTGLVLVPQDRAAQVQLSLAASGITRSKAVGLELLQEEPSLGISHFTETARYQHALETELSRTISTMRNVESARVHLAMPKQSVFIRDREQASASVMIKPRAGRSIEEEQVNSIVSLVASSIPYLETGQVTVVDQWGRLLSTGDDTAGGASRDQYRHARKLEKLYAERIESLLTPIVGKGRVRAIVTAEVDFSINERTEESFNGDPAKLRSEQKENQINSNGAAVGVPGALTNQPPGNGTTDPEANAALADGDQPSNQSSSEIRNYELDKTITHVQQAPGSIRRLSAAIIIDDRMTVDADGNPVRTPLTDEEIAEYTTLARGAIGFNEQRGDNVQILNRSFQPVEEILPIEPLPLWKQNWLWTMVRQSLIGLSVLLLVLLVLRPAVKRLAPQKIIVPDVIEEDSSTATEPQQAQSTSEAPADSKTSNAALEPPPVVYGDILNMARAMAAEDPRRVAKVVKDWVSDQ
jgi:flagellar M-ring protein FliF